MAKLLAILNMDRFQLEAKFSRAALSSHILELQESGEKMQLSNDGWVAREGSDNDPNNSTGIDNTWKVNGEPSGDDLIDCLRQIDSYHKQAREAIADYLNKAQKAKVNRAGSTEPARRTSDNADSCRPGPRSDKFTVKPQQLLDYLQRDRQKVETELAIQQEINAERKKALNARMELAEVKKETSFSAS